MSTDDEARRTRLRQRRALNPPVRPLRDLGDKVHLRTGRSLRRLMLVTQYQGSNGRPEPAPYRFQGQRSWQPAQVKLYGSESSALKAERGEWAAANAELVERIRSRLTT